MKDDYSVSDPFKKFALNFWVAGISAAIAKTVIAPIERTKLILQNQDSVLSVLQGKKRQYNGIVDCLIRITKEQGFVSLYRGNGINIMRYFPMQALNFAFNSHLGPIFVDLIGTETYVKRFFVKSLAGGCAGGATISILFPLEFCTTRIAVDMGGGKNSGTAREFNGLFDCVKKIRQKDGYKGLYFGYPVAAFGTTLYRAFYFGLFDTFKLIWELNKPAMYADRPKPPFLIEMSIAQASTIVASLIIYPIDTVARRMMLQAGRPVELRLYKHWSEVIPVILKTQGVKGFYKGALANCFRSISGALVLVLYDEIMIHTLKIKWVNKWITACDNC